LSNIQKEDFHFSNSFKHPKISLVYQEQDLGIAASRNSLLKLSKGDYIAWLDADDRFQTDKLEVQLDYIKKNFHIDVLGSALHCVAYPTQSDIDYVAVPPESHDALRAFLWYKNYMYQPSLLSKNFYVKEQLFYNEDFKNSVEDYELWYRLIKTKTFHNLSTPLTYYKTDSPEEEAQKRSTRNFKKNIEVLWKTKWADAGINASDEDKELFVSFLYQNQSWSQKEISAILNILKQGEILLKGEYHELMRAYLKLRLWNACHWTLKIRNIHLLKNIFKLNAMYKNALI
jgi:glycosyltransferase involved in cell wall biosynthesis